MSESFFVANPIGYLDAPSEQAKNDAKTTASNDCQRITGIGEVTQVFESDGDCNLEDGWPELIRKYWICTAMDTYGCKITKP